MQTKFTKESIPLVFAVISVILLPFYIQGNSFFTILFGLSSLLFFYKKFKFTNLKNPSFIFAILFYIILFLSAFFSANQEEGFNNLGKKSFIIFLPLIFSLVYDFRIQWLKALLTAFVLSTISAVIISLFYSVFQIANGANLDILTHSRFTDFIGLQSTYLAIYMLASIFTLYFSFYYELLHPKVFKSKLKIFFLAFLIVFTILIGTRILYLPLLSFLIYIILKEFKKQKRLVIILSLALALMSAFMITTKIPLFETRLSEFQSTDFSVLKLKKFEHDTPINGLTMRLLFGKFGIEVLSENNTFLFGEGLGDAQDMIHCKFVEYNIYMGNPLIGDTGYLAYNYHNQYMQILVQTGVFGLVIFLSIFLMAFNRKNPLLNAILLTYLIIFFVESAIERQNGISHIFFFIFLLVKLDLKLLINSEH